MATGAVVYVPIRTVSGLFSAGANGTVRGLKSWRPDATTPLVDKDGLIRPEWHRYFRYQDEQVLGGADGSTLPQVEDSITISQAQSLFTSLLTNALTQMATANAQSLKTTVEVVQNAALAGASSIPPVVLVPAETSAGGE